jgi:hypothetical protein
MTEAKQTSGDDRLAAIADDIRSATARMRRSAEDVAADTIQMGHRRCSG